MLHDDLRNLCIEEKLNLVEEFQHYYVATTKEFYNKEAKEVQPWAVWALLPKDFVASNTIEDVRSEIYKKINEHVIQGQGEL